MKFIKQLLVILALCNVCASSALSETTAHPSEVILLRMKMMILPGTRDYLRRGLQEAAHRNAAAVIVQLDTPGGVLQTTQEMVQSIFESAVPVAVYVGPSGATATSAGVFITSAAHIAAMAPGTSIGAAHPVEGSGKDIEGDMRKKAENATVAMVKSVADQRGRNKEWLEKAVRESVSVTSKEALDLKVIDVLANDIPELLKAISGRKILVQDKIQTIPDISHATVTELPMEFREQAINFLGHPNVAALLWLAATTGLSVELYNPGAILPGVVGIICLVLALAVGQIIPLSQGAILLLVAGAAMIGLELFFPSFILGIGGIIAMSFGALYLIDTQEAPGLGVTVMMILPTAITLGALMLLVVTMAVRQMRRKVSTGVEALVGEIATVTERLNPIGKVTVQGEIWRARSFTPINVGETVVVVQREEGLQLLVEPRAG